MSLFGDDPLKGHEDKRVKPNADRDPAMKTPDEPPPMPSSTQIVCPHCQTRGHVVVTREKRKRGVSGGKATGAVLTGGVSLLAFGLSRKQKVRHLACSNCGMEWDVT